MHGCFNELIDPERRRRRCETTEFMASRIDEFGTPAAYNHYAVGWAHAMDTPYQWTKQVASHWGGTRNGTIVHWPNGIEAKGEVRNQFHHVIDVAPTVLEAAGLPEPTTVHGVEQKPIEGVSMRYAFDDAGAAERHETQYFEMFCNRGIYHKGWTAVTRHSTPWVIAELPPFADDTWELYDTNTDWSQAHDLAAEMPEKLAELKALFMEEARKYNVLPLDDRRVERFNSDLAGRPTLISGNSQLLFGGMGRLSENVGAQRQEQVALGDRRDSGSRRRRGGRDRRPGRRVRRLEPVRQGRQADVLLQPVRPPALQRRGRRGDPAGHAPGADGVRLRRRRARQGRRRSRSTSTATKTGEGRVEGTVPMVFSADETCDVGSDTASPVSDDYTSEGSRFTGTVDWVQIDIADAAEDLDHLITPEERLKIAMARQ